MKRFELYGISYYQEYRKCGKASCTRCADGPGHGPYWWSRDRNGKRKYIGVNLPKEITDADQERREMISAARAYRMKLSNQIAALDRLLNNSPLQDGDRDVFKALGIGLKQGRLF